MEALWKMMEQGGFAAVAGFAILALGALAKYHVDREKYHDEDRAKLAAAHEAEVKALRDVHEKEHVEFETCLTRLADRMMDAYGLQVKAEEQNTAALQALKDAFGIYERLQGLTDYVRQKRGAAGHDDRGG